MEKEKASSEAIPFRIGRRKMGKMRLGLSSGVFRSAVQSASKMPCPKEAIVLEENNGDTNKK